jgi:signal transduction histidine kinase
MWKQLTEAPVWLKVCLLALVYALTAMVGFVFALKPGNVTVFWPPSGIALAVLLLGGRQLWLGIPLGYIAANLYYYQSLEAPYLSAFILSSIGATLQALVGTWAVQRFLPQLRPVLATHEVGIFTSIALLTALIAPTLGVTALSLMGVALGGHPSLLWLTWWVGDTLGILLFTPVLMAWHQPRPEHPEHPQWLRILFFFSLPTALYMIFLNPLTSQYPLLWILYSIQVWAAFILSYRGVVFCNLMLSLAAIYGTSHGLGIFTSVEPSARLVILQGFVGVMSVLSLLLAATLYEQQQTTRSLMLANQSKSDFLAKMSHELRTPLNAILGFARQLKKQSTQFDERQQLYLERIQTNGAHLLNLINDILDIARIEAHRLELHPEPVDLSQLIQTTTRELEILVQQHQLILFVECPSKLSPLQADPHRLRQVLANLLSNAIKFTPVGGEISVRVTAKGNLPESLSVTDSGIGIVPERQQEIFKPFEQEDNATSRRYGGSGLGLAISRELSQLMGFNLSLAHSIPGSGSEFRIDFFPAQK